MRFLATIADGARAMLARSWAWLTSTRQGSPGWDDAAEAERQWEEAI